MFKWLDKQKVQFAVITTLVATLLSLSALSPASAQIAGEEQIRAEISQQREVAASVDRESEPVAWAVAQTDLARRLYEPGDHDSLLESVALYRAALEVLTPDATRSEWLVAQEGLGDALFLIGAWRSGASALGILATGSYHDPGVDSRDAALAFRAVLNFRTRENDGVGWARLQTKLGHALNIWTTRQLFLRAEITETDAIQNEAENAFRQALGALSLRDNPEEWASANQGLMMLYSMAAEFIGQEYVEDEAALRRSEARRLRYVRAAMASAREAERAHQRSGDEELAQYTRQHLERLRENLRPNRIAPNR